MSERDAGCIATRVYPCLDCDDDGRERFTVCDACWDKKVSQEQTVASLRQELEQANERIELIREMKSAYLSRMEAAEATLARVRWFVTRERALRDAVGKGGQSVGESPCISPSVLRELERMLGAAKGDQP